MSEPDSDTRFHGRYIWAVISLIVAATWLRQAFSSLWLDELGTAWVIMDGLSLTIERAFEYHGQSPAYYVLAWLVTRVGGRSELVLRLPSLVAAVLSTWVLWRIVGRLVNREAARIAIVGFLALATVASAALDARPYAIALLLLLGATDGFTRWMDGARTRDAIVFVLLAAATVWTHYLFALALVPLLAFGLLGRRERTVPIARQVVAWAMVALTVAPLIPHLASLYSRRGSLSIPYSGSFVDLLFFVVPPVLAGGAGLGLILARATAPVELGPSAGRRGSLFFLSTWLVVPPTALVLISVLEGASLYSSRYYVSAAPAAAALFGWAVSRIEPAQARRIIVVVTASFAVLIGGGVLRSGEDWRGAAAAERQLAEDDTIVFLHPAFVESAQLEWLEDPGRVDYLLSPLDYYAMDGEIVPMPYLLDGPDVEAYLDQITRRYVVGADRFLLVTRYPFVPFREWWDGRLGDEGWHSRSLGTFGVIEIIEFLKDGASRSPA